MFALPKTVFSAVTLPFNTRCQSAWRLELWRLFSSSRTIFKFSRPQPTDAELLEMSPNLRWYYMKRNDQEFRHNRTATTQLRYIKLRQQMLEDPQLEKSTKAQWRENNQKFWGRRRIKSMLRKALQRMPESQRDAYDWKSHRPIVMSEPRLMTCDVCLTHTVRGTLWWQRIDRQSASGTSDAKQYTCHSCYMDQDSDKILPRGLESYVLGSGKRFPKPKEPC
jgi:hypothetical protein